ncbi:putative integral membrane protein [Cryptosporidium felis]|nr:putative integral membrane protein [Cryptosporidium felis]
MKRLINVVLFHCLFYLLATEKIHCKGYRETRINKVVRIESRSRLRDALKPGKCEVESVNITSFMNTSRWRRIKNKLGTGWSDDLIPPLIFCAKVLDMPFNKENSCGKNSFELIVQDGMHKKIKSVTLAAISNITKGGEKCVFVSPCNILRLIYWGDDSFSNPVNNLEFNLNVKFESNAPNQRFIATISIKGLARSLKKSRNPWDTNIKLTEKFKNVQAVSLFIPYKPHSKSFVSDSCIVKPKVTSIFYGKDKPSLCKFNNCMWNIWIGQLTGEFVNEKCTLGKASSRGDFITGWFSPYALDSETIGSVKLKMRWDTSSRQVEEICSLRPETEEHIVNYNRENAKLLHGNLRSDWFPGQEDTQIGNSYSTEVNDIKVNSIPVEKEYNKSTSAPIDEVGTVTQGEEEPNTINTSTSTSTPTSNPTSTSSILTPKISIMSPRHDSNGVNVCVNGRCRAANNLWSNCHFNMTRHLNSEDPQEQKHIALSSYNGEPQIEWIEVNKSSKVWKVDGSGNLLFDVDGCIDNGADFNVTSNRNYTDEKISYRIEKISVCMQEGLINEDITVVDVDDNHEGSSEFEEVSENLDKKSVLEKWLDLKRIHEP